jgi:hypothetical protein
MYVQVWRKYLPVIKLLLKKSAAGDQVLEMSGIDFTRAAGGKKVKFTFDVQLVNGRLYQVDKQAALVKDLVQILQEDEAAKKLMVQQELQLTMGSNFQLKIKNTTPVQEAVAVESADENNEAG